MVPLQSGLYCRCFIMCAIQMNPVCVVTSDLGLFFVYLFVCVVGPGFDSTSPAFVRSRASQAAGNDGRLAPKNGIGPPFLGAGIV